MPQFPFNLRPVPPTAVAPSGKATELPSDIDALDSRLFGLLGRTLAMSDGHGAWMCPRVIPLVHNGRRPTAFLSVECVLVSHGRRGNALELVLEGECGTRGTLKLTFPPQGWKLHLVEPNPVPTVAAPNPTVNAPKPPDEEPKEKPGLPPELAGNPEDSVRKKRDDLFRSIFS